ARMPPYSNPEMAGVYQRITGPRQFALPGRDLIELVQPPAGARILDVGSGTGAVAENAIRRVGFTGCVVGVDASIEMLRVARRTRMYPSVAGALPRLPFRDPTFDIVTAGFVISHVADYQQALAAGVRGCR